MGILEERGKGGGRIFEIMHAWKIQNLLKVMNLQEAQKSPHGNKIQGLTKSNKETVVSQDKENQLMNKRSSIQI